MVNARIELTIDEDQQRYSLGDIARVKLDGELEQRWEVVEVRGEESPFNALRLPDPAALGLCEYRWTYVLEWRPEP